MGTRCSGFGWPGAQDRPSNKTINRLGGCQVAAEGVCASVRRCVAAFRGAGSSVCAAADQPFSPFVWIGREKVQSLLRWAGLPNPGRQQHITPGGYAAVSFSDCQGFFFFWHRPQRLFCAGKPKLLQNTLRTQFQPCARHFRFQQPFFGSYGWTIHTKRIDDCVELTLFIRLFKKYNLLRFCPNSLGFLLCARLCERCTELDRNIVDITSIPQCWINDMLPFMKTTYDLIQTHQMVNMKREFSFSPRNLLNFIPVLFCRRRHFTVSAVIVTCRWVLELQ